MRPLPLNACHDTYPLRAGRDAIGQVNIPAFLALVHAHDYAGLAGRVVSKHIKQQKPRAQLSHRNAVAVENQTDPDVGGMTALAA